MTRHGPSTLSGGQSEVFASRSMGTDKKNFTEREDKRKIEGQSESCVKSSFIDFYSVRRENLLSGVKRRKVKQAQSAKKKIQR